ncbi:LysR family transcriptional regulator [Sodalis sp. RH22]|uniref:LysR family transcriptional regulator n=1 Tax=unclassified Sodalis (in: enterobacteria) TaxID=2636512 RepID=UPI0039B564F4
MMNHPHIELAWLEDCAALAESLNFSRAAELRHVTQPAFSRRIQALEEWAGTPLFERSRGGVRLTAAGEVFHPQAVALLRAIQDLRAKTLEAAGKGAQMIIFCATHSLSSLFFPHWLRESGITPLDGQVKLVSDTLLACERLFLRGDAQFLLCHSHPDAGRGLENAHFTSVQVGEDILLPLCAPDATGKRPKWSLDDMARPIPYLSYSTDSGLGRIIATQRHMTAQLAKMDRVFTSDLAATLLAMARAGDGVAWLPRTLAQADLLSGALVAAAVRDRRLEVPVQIRVFRPASSMTRAAERLWQAIAGQGPR